MVMVAMMTGHGQNEHEFAVLPLGRQPIPQAAQSSDLNNLTSQTKFEHDLVQIQA
jgi:hypothetical protein